MSYKYPFVDLNGDPPIPGEEFERVQRAIAKDRRDRLIEMYAGFMHAVRWRSEVSEATANEDRIASVLKDATRLADAVISATEIKEHKSLRERCEETLNSIREEKI
jgi:hypothetical protein